MLPNQKCARKKTFIAHTEKKRLTVYACPKCDAGVPKLYETK